MTNPPAGWKPAPHLVLIVLLAMLPTLHAARRPRYGGELRIETRAVLKSLSPLDDPDDPVALGTQRQLLPAVFETLVRLDDHGEPKPWLAVSWTHDTKRKVWVFEHRKNVKFQDGSDWSPPEIAIPDDRPIEQILRELAGPRNAVTLKSADGTLVGTGPFKLAKWDAGKSATLAAHDQYWGGRPYLDSIAIQMGRSLADQANDLQVGKADAIEIAVRDLKATKPRGMVVSSTPPMETVTLQFDAKVSPSVRQALALSIDRVAIQNALLQKEGEISGALLPRWLSGYAFVFPWARDVTKAKQLSPGAAPVTFSYDRNDAVIRPIAERIAVNAGEAGLMLRTVVSGGSVNLARLPITAGDPWLALSDIAVLLKQPAPSPVASPYEAEKKLLDDSGVVPLLQLPQGWMMPARVRNWPHFEDVWLDPGAVQ